MHPKKYWGNIHVYTTLSGIWVNGTGVRCDECIRYVRLPADGSRQGYHCNPPCGVLCAMDSRHTHARVQSGRIHGYFDFIRVHRDTRQLAGDGIYPNIQRTQV